MGQRVRHNLLSEQWQVKWFLENIKGVLDYLASCDLLGRIKIIGTGTSDEVNQGLRNGNIQFAIDEKPFLLGETAIDVMCRKLFLNLDLPKTFLIPSELRIACQLDHAGNTVSGALVYSSDEIWNSVGI